MRGKRYGWALVIAFFMVGPVQGQEVAGLVSECEACHGPGGVSTEADVPSLAGRGTTYIREKLDQFHNYERHCSTTTYRHSDRPKTPTSMCNVANSLSEEDKQAVAEYFARQ
jgi:sulfide dehydrogenase cytochrome subunit